MTAKKKGSARERILEELESLETVDCHSHTMLRRDYYGVDGGHDLFGIMGYFSRDIHSTAGGDIYKGARTDEERWARLRAVLARACQQAHTRILPIDYDPSPRSETGCSGWVQFPDGAVDLGGAPPRRVR